MAEGDLLIPAGDQHMTSSDWIWVVARDTVIKFKSLIRVAIPARERKNPFVL